MNDKDSDDDFILPAPKKQKTDFRKTFQKQVFIIYLFIKMCKFSLI